MPDVMKIVKEGVESSDPTVLSILIAVAVVLLTLFILLIRRGGSKRRGVLIVGLCDAGKTSLFSRLIDERSVATYTSIKENKGIYISKKSQRSVQLIDLPGHERLRPQYIEQYKNLARGIIFLVDSLTLQKEVKDVAEFLYILLCDQVLSGNKVPFLITCNKQDLSFAKGKNIIKTQLEKEINLLRETHSAALQDTDSNKKSKLFLGKRNKEFDFSQLQSTPIDFVECSVTSTEAAVENVSDWLIKIA